MGLGSSIIKFFIFILSHLYFCEWFFFFHLFSHTYHASPAIITILSFFPHFPSCTVSMPHKENLLIFGKLVKSLLKLKQNQFWKICFSLIDIFMHGKSIIPVCHRFQHTCVCNSIAYGVWHWNAWLTLRWCYYNKSQLRIGALWDEEANAGGKILLNSLVIPLSWIWKRACMSHMSYCDMMCVTEILLKEDCSSHEKRSYPMHNFISVLGRGSHRFSKISNFHNSTILSFQIWFLFKLM